MDNGMIAVAEAIGTMGKVNTESETTTAMQLMTQLMSYVPLTQAFSKVLEDDESQYYAATLDIQQSNPQEAAVASADYAQYLTDSGKMSGETGALSSAIQNQKTEVQQEGNSMGQIFEFASSLQSVEKLGTSIAQTRF